MECANLDKALALVKERLQNQIIDGAALTIWIGELSLFSPLAIRELIALGMVSGVTFIISIQSLSHSVQGNFSTLAITFLYTGQEVYPTFR